MIEYMKQIIALLESKSDDTMIYGLEYNNTKVIDNIEYKYNNDQLIASIYSIDDKKIIDINKWRIALLSDIPIFVEWSSNHTSFDDTLIRLSQLSNIQNKTIDRFWYLITIPSHYPHFQ